MPVVLAGFVAEFSLKVPVVPLLILLFAGQVVESREVSSKSPEIDAVALPSVAEVVCTAAFNDNEQIEIANTLSKGR